MLKFEIYQELKIVLYYLYSQLFGAIVEGKLEQQVADKQTIA